MSNVSIKDLNKIETLSSTASIPVYQEKSENNTTIFTHKVQYQDLKGQLEKDTNINSLKIKVNNIPNYIITSLDGTETSSSTLTLPTSFSVLTGIRKTDPTAVYSSLTPVQQNITLQVDTNSIPEVSQNGPGLLNYEDYSSFNRKIGTVNPSTNNQDPIPEEGIKVITNLSQTNTAINSTIQSLSPATTANPGLMNSTDKKRMFTGTAIVEYFTPSTWASFYTLAPNSQKKIYPIKIDVSALSDGKSIIPAKTFTANSSTQWVEATSGTQPYKKAVTDFNKEYEVLGLQSFTCASSQNGVFWEAISLGDSILYNATSSNKIIPKVGYGSLPIHFTATFTVRIK